MEETNKNMRYWEPETGAAWTFGQYQDLPQERQEACSVITEVFWMDEIIARNSAGEGQLKTTL